MANLNLAVIGLGQLGERVAQRALPRIEGRPEYGKDLSDLVNQVCWVDTDPSVRQRFQKEFILDTGKLYDSTGSVLRRRGANKINCAIIATPVAHHFDSARPFIEAGIHTLVAKPIADTPEKAEALISLANRHLFPVAVSGSQTVFHDGIIDALRYIEDNGVHIGDVHLEWNKNRAAKSHPIPGNTQEEGSHPFGVLYALKPEMPVRIYAVGRKGNVIIRPDREGLARATAGIEIVEEGYEHTGSRIKKDIDQQISEYLLAEIETASRIICEYKDGSLATINMSFEQPLKERSVRIEGKLPDTPLFDNQVGIEVTLTEGYDADNAPYAQNRLIAAKGIVPGKVGGGFGNLDMQAMYGKVDDLGSQFEAFFRFAETGQLQPGLMTLEQADAPEAVLNGALASIKKGDRVEYKDGSYE